MGIGHRLLSDLYALPKGRQGGKEDRWVKVIMGSCRYSFAPGFLVWPVVVARALRWLNQQQTNPLRLCVQAWNPLGRGSSYKMAAFMSLRWGEE